MCLFLIRQRKLARLADKITRIKSLLDKKDDEVLLLKLTQTVTKYRILKNKTYFESKNGKSK